MKVKIFVFNKMLTNCCIVWDEAARTAVVVDPGSAAADERAELESFLSGEGLRPLAVLLTHLHIDHMAGAEALCKRFGIECLVSGRDSGLSGRQEEIANLYHLEINGPLPAVHYFDAGTRSLQFEGIRVEVLPLGGHTAGSVAYYFPEAGVVCVGDTIVRGSLGFLESGFGPVLETIRDYLLPLPDGTLMLPGHGETSTIGEEKRSNRFFIRCSRLGRSE